MKPIKKSPLPRLGNKQLDIKFFNKFIPLDSIYIVEPFAGSFAIIRNIFYEDKYIKHINDLDKNLFYCYKNIDEYIRLMNYYNDKIKEIENQEISISEKFKNKKVYKKEIEEINFFGKILVDNFFVRGSLCKHKKAELIYKEYINLLKKSIITNLDYEEILIQYQENQEAFLFIDPPYMESNNDNYENSKLKNDQTDIYVYLIEYLKNPKTKCKILFIINDSYIMKYLFKDYIKGNYSKTYGISNKTKQHLIISNY